MDVKKPVSFRLPEAAKARLVRLASILECSATDVVIRAVRELDERTSPAPPAAPRD